jgi:hypothetical protein
MSEWLGLIGTLAGVVIGGFITNKVATQQHLHERLLEKRRHKIEAFEAIYEILSAIVFQVSILKMSIIGCLGYSSPLKGDILKEKIQIDRLRMLVDFYVPTIKPNVESISAQLIIIGKYVSEALLEKNRTEEWKDSTIKAAHLASIEIENIAREAQEKLSKQMQILTDEI